MRSQVTNRSTNGGKLKNSIYQFSFYILKSVVIIVCLASLWCCWVGDSIEYGNLALFPRNCTPGSHGTRLYVTLCCCSLASVARFPKKALDLRWKHQQGLFTMQWPTGRTRAICGQIFVLIRIKKRINNKQQTKNDNSLLPQTTKHTRNWSYFDVFHIFRIYIFQISGRYLENMHVSEGQLKAILDLAGLGMPTPPPNPAHLRVKYPLKLLKMPGYTEHTLKTVAARHANYNKQTNKQTNSKTSKQ